MATGRYETGPSRHALEAAVVHICHPEWGLTYQSCRFCKASWPEVEKLYKYAVRHYICEGCRNRKLGSAK